jgi:hypothetical protein
MENYIVVIVIGYFALMYFATWLWGVIMMFEGLMYRIYSKRFYIPYEKLDLDIDSLSRIFLMMFVSSSFYFGVYTLI